jgi:hypothetical protein
MLRLYFDEDAMDDALATALRIRSVDVLTAFEAGMADGEPPGVPQRLVLRRCGAGNSRPLGSDCLQGERSSLLRLYGRGGSATVTRKIANAVTYAAYALWAQ